MSNGFPTYPDLKQSGLDWLGRIPASWELRRLGSLFEERRTKVSDTDFQALSVTMDGIVPQLETAAKTKDGDNRKLVKTNDLVINSRSDRKGSSGLSPLSGSVSLISIVLAPTDIHPRFAHHLIRSSAFQDEFYRYGKGIVADLWSTNYASMKNILVPTMPRSEQAQIARFLDHETATIDALIEKQHQLIDLLQEKRQAAISHAVTKGLDPDAPMRDSGVEWLREIPTHWHTPALFNRYEIALGKMLDERKFTGKHAIPYLRNADVNWDTINVDNLPVFDVQPSELERYSLRLGDLLVCEGGAGVGQTAIWRGQLQRCSFQKALHRLRPRHAESENPRLLYYCMRYVVETGIILAGGTATIPHLTAEQLRRYRFPRPPKYEQDRIVDFLDQEISYFIGIESKALQVVELLQERRAALISAAVTGKIDVRRWTPPPSDTDAEAR